MIISEECDHDVLYSVLIGIDKYATFKYEKQQVYEQEAEYLHLLENQDTDERSDNFTRFLSDIIKLTRILLLLL